MKKSLEDIENLDLTTEIGLLALEYGLVFLHANLPRQDERIENALINDAHKKGLMDLKTTVGNLKGIRNTLCDHFVRMTPEQHMQLREIGLPGEYKGESDIKKLLNNFIRVDKKDPNKQGYERCCNINDDLETIQKDTEKKTKGKKAKGKKTKGVSGPKKIDFTAAYLSKAKKIKEADPNLDHNENFLALAMLLVAAGTCARELKVNIKDAEILKDLKILRDQRLAHFSLADRDLNNLREELAQYDINKFLKALIELQEKLSHKDQKDSVQITSLPFEPKTVNIESNNSNSTVVSESQSEDKIESNQDKEGKRTIEQVSTSENQAEGETEHVSKEVKIESQINTSNSTSTSSSLAPVSSLVFGSNLVVSNQENLIPPRPSEANAPRSHTNTPN